MAYALAKIDMARALPTQILVPVTFDTVSLGALCTARDLAQSCSARLRVVHVWNAPYAATEIAADEVLHDANNLIDRARHECAEDMRKFLASANLPTGGLDLEWAIHSGPTAREILAYCRTHGCDWIVMGTHRHRGLSHWLLGSVAEEVLKHAICPVLVVPGPRPGE